MSEENRNLNIGQMQEIMTAVGQTTKKTFLKKNVVGVNLHRTAVLTPENWIHDTSDETSWPYYYDVAVAGLTDEIKADVTVCRESLDVATACKFCPVNQTFDGVLRLFAGSVPAGNITITYSFLEGISMQGSVNVGIIGTTSGGSSGGGSTTTDTNVTVGTALNDCTWAEISAIAQAGLGDTYFDVGDCKEITLTGNIGSCLTMSGQRFCVFILDFNHAENGTADNNIIFGGFKTALTDGADVALVDSKYGTNSTDGTICFNMSHKTTATSGDGQYGYNHGGWRGSDLRYDILGATNTAPSQYNTDKNASNIGYNADGTEFTNPKANTMLQALPSDLRNVMRLWKRYVDAIGGASDENANVIETIDAISLLTESEIFDTRSYANVYEQNYNTQMAYYANGNSRVKYKHNDSSSAVWWWECSPGYSISGSFCFVDTDGDASSSRARFSCAVAPAFKV